MNAETARLSQSVVDVIRAFQRVSAANALLVLFATAAAAQASFRLPAPSGPHIVGTTRFTVDRGTPDAAPLVVIAWYPTADSTRLTRSPSLREEAALRQMAALGRIPNSTAAMDRWVEDTRLVVDEITRLNRQPAVLDVSV